MFGSRVRQLATVTAALGLSAGLVVTGLAASTASASGAPGVTATQVTIGATVPLTGIASPGYSEVGKAARAVFKYINAHGKINGRTVNYILKDDCYGTAGFGCTGTPNTSTQTNALLATPGGIFATVGSLGTPTQDSVRALLKSNNTPQLFVNSGSKDWNCQSSSTANCSGGPYPHLYGWQQSYNTESKILGKYMKTAYAGKKVCFFGQNDDFGTDGHQGLVTAGVTLADSKYYSVTAFVLGGGNYIKGFFTTFHGEGCQVVFLDTIPAVTAASIQQAKNVNFAPKWVISSVGSDPITVHKVLGSKGSEVGAISFAELPASTDPSAAAKTWKAWIIKVIKADPTDFPGFSAAKLDGNMAYGATEAVDFALALKATPTLTQANFLNTLDTMTFKTAPTLLALKYSATNHQGLLGGYVIKIASASSTAVVNKTVYQTDNGAGPVVAATGASLGMGAIPSWMK